jgi:hypothetical protein
MIGFCHNCDLQDDFIILKALKFIIHIITHKYDDLNCLRSHNYRLTGEYIDS